jgi:hypothetical protein
MSNFAFFSFADSPKQDLATLLPHLPEEDTLKIRFLAFLNGLLQASASARAKFWQAVQEGWIATHSETDLTPHLRDLIK